MSIGPLPVEVPTDVSVAPEAKKEVPSPPSRRSTRIRAPEPGKYAESSDDDTPLITNARQTTRPSGLERELGVLKETAGIHTPAESSDSDMAHIAVQSVNGRGGASGKGNGKGKGREMEVVQGMCEVVEVRIDNLRPTETQVTEADFLDEERSGDEDWDGEDDEGGGEYAW